MRKVPLRTCIVTKEKIDKKDLIRIVKNKEENVFIDLTGKANGHGIYLKKDLDVIKKARSGKILNKALETEVTNTIYDELEKIVRSDNNDC